MRPKPGWREAAESSDRSAGGAEGASPGVSISQPPTLDPTPHAWYRTEVMYAIIQTGGKQYKVAEGTSSAAIC